jgi:hypothetical protein
MEFYGLSGVSATCRERRGRLLLQLTRMGGWRE